MEQETERAEGERLEPPEGAAASAAGAINQISYLIPRPERVSATCLPTSTFDKQYKPNRLFNPFYDTDDESDYTDE